MVAELKRGSQVVSVCNDLAKEWQGRNAQFKTWYNVLRQYDEFQQADMESYVSNDPRTFYNLALFLLTPDPIPHRILVGDENIQITKAAQVAEFIEAEWRRKEVTARHGGQQSWLRHFVSLMLATGWYSVFGMATKEELVGEIWNPAEVYPDFGGGEMTQCAHVFKLNRMAAIRRVLDKGWSVRADKIPASGVTIYDYWFFNDQGQVTNAVSMDTTLVIPPQVFPKLQRMPIVCSPVGGLPDDGTITGDTNWRNEIGQSIFATNLQVYKAQNKVMSHLLQILRDTAQQRWVETSADGTPILQEENMFKRGAVFRKGPLDNIDTLPVGNIPTELRTVMFDITNQVQRGSLPWAMFGNIQQEMASYLMSQISTAAKQVLTDYRNAVKGALEDIDTIWIEDMLGGERPRDFDFPSDLNPEFTVDVGVDLMIPGDLVLRANTARTLSPTFRLSKGTTLGLLFPEVKDPMREQAAANADTAMESPIAQAISLVGAFRDEAARLKEGGHGDLAEMFEGSATSIQQKLAQQGGEGGAMPEAPALAPAAAPPGEIPPREMQGQVM